MIRIKKRLSRLENVKEGCFCGFIGQYFDDLTTRERERWTQYRFGVDASTVAEVEQSTTGTLHFLCDKRTKEPTKAELVAIMNDIQQIVLGVNQC